MPTTTQIKKFATNPEQFVADLAMSIGGKSIRFGDVAAPHQIEWVTSLAPPLLAIVEGTTPPIGRFWIEATKGASKDSTLSACVLYLLAFAKRGLRIQVGAADKDQANELGRAARDLLRLNPWLANQVTAKNYSFECEATGSECEVIPSDVAGSHGARPDVLILNEISHVKRWEFCENLLDNASKVPHGLAIIATNAGFTGSEAWKWREIAQTSPRWKFHQFDKPAPWISEAEMSEARARNSHERFMRLWYGVWSSGAGDALDGVDIDAAIDPNLSPMEGYGVPSALNAHNSVARLLPSLQYRSAEEIEKQKSERQVAKQSSATGYSFVAGLDLGIKHDHSALVVLACNHQTQRIRLAHCQSWSPINYRGQVDLEIVEQAVADASRTFRLSGVYFDPYQAALMAQRLTRRAVRMVEVPFVGSSLNLMATTLLEVFRSRRVDLYHHDRLVSDLRRLRIVEKSYGHRLEATRDSNGHCDLGTAFAIVLPAAVNLASERYGPGSVVNFDVPVRFVDQLMRAKSGSLYRFS